MAPVAWIGMIGIQVTASPIAMVVENRSAAALQLSIGLNSNPPLWEGVLKPGSTARGSGKIRGDGHTVIRCRPPGGSERVKEDGYVTHGMDARVIITVRSCDDIDVDQQDFLL